MSKYQSAQVELAAMATAGKEIKVDHEALSITLTQDVISSMLREYATHLRELESAKVGVTEVQKLERWGKAPAGSKYLLQPMDDGYWTPWHIAQQALEAVAPHLASARVPEREALEAIKRLPARPFPDPVAHSWEAFGRAVMGAFTDAKFIAIRALSAAPKPEKE